MCVCRFGNENGALGFGEGNPDKGMHPDKWHSRFSRLERNSNMVRQKQANPLQRVVNESPKRKNTKRKLRSTMEKVNYSQWKAERCENALLFHVPLVQHEFITCTSEEVICQVHSLGASNLICVDPDGKEYESTELESHVVYSWRTLHEKNLLMCRMQRKHWCISIDTQTPRQQSAKHAIQILMKWILLHATERVRYPYPKEFSSFKTKGFEPYASKAFDTADLLQCSVAQPTTSEGNAYQPSQLLRPVLRSYQKAAVAWMLERELHESEEPKETPCSVYYVQFENGVYYDPFLVEFHTTCPPTYRVDRGIRGGVLADEMGLGKTVEVLSCILSHQRNYIDQDLTQLVAERPIPRASKLLCYCDDRVVKNPLLQVMCRLCGTMAHQECVSHDEPYVCLTCMPTLPCKTTLIVSPAPIHRQWVQEVERHCPGLKVLVYKGVRKSRRDHPHLLWASELAKYDIVITTYATLSSDIHYTDQIKRKLRREAKFPPTPSPLTRLQWWRVCLDEAQMVESTTSQSAAMASRLESINRWCVTGTPFSKDLEQLFGLLVFLKAEPFCHKFWWKHLLRDQFLSNHPERLYDMLRLILWRNHKHQVADQIQLPPQTQVEHWLMFSEIEAQFYASQEKQCRQPGDKKEDVTSKLLRLRQACGHPQIGTFGVGTLAKTAMSMPDILAKMIQNAKRKCEEEQRSLLSIQNLLAGLFMLQEHKTQAIQMYFDSISEFNSNARYFQADALQRFHILYNLLKLLDVEAGNPVEIDQKDWKPEIKALKQYMKDNVVTDQVKDEVNRIQGGIVFLEKEYLLIAATRHFTALEKVKEHQDDITTRLGTVSWWHLASNFSGFDISAILENVSFDVAGWSGLQFILASRQEELIETRESAMSALAKLNQEPTRREIFESGNCSNCREMKRDSGIVCQHCKLEPVLMQYHGLLYKSADSLTDSDYFAVLNRIKRFLFGAVSDPATKELIKDQFRLYEMLQAECLALKQLWTTQHERLSSLDELEMAKSTMKLRLESDPQHHSTILASMIPYRLAEAHQERILAATSLDRARHHFRYLQHLHTQHSSVDICPICQESSKNNVILPCAHSFCYKCMMRWIAGRQKLFCPTCRARTNVKDCTLLDQKVPVHSGYGTKVDHVVFQVMEIVKESPDAKVIVFSLWKDLLRLVSMALQANDLSCIVATGRGEEFLNAIDTFRSTESRCVLGLLYTAGANGLNLTEATHVFLIDPLVNMGTEHQAINRIHRIGQEKKTKVHRFFIRKTIDERIYNFRRQVDPSAEVSSKQLESLLLNAEPLAELG